MPPVQLPWVNLVTDGLLATALTFNLPDEGARQAGRCAGPCRRGLFTRYMITGLYVGRPPSADSHTGTSAATAARPCLSAT